MELIEIAFNYDFRGEHGPCRMGEAVGTRGTKDGTLPDERGRLSATLLFLQRQDRHVEDPRSFEEIPLVRALMAQIRDAV